MRYRFLVTGCVAGLLLLGTACPKKTQTFDPAPAPEVTDGAGGTAGTAGGAVEPLPDSRASEFGEKPVADLGESTGAAVGEIQEGDLRKIEAGLLTVYFDYNSPELTGDALRTLEANAAWIMKFPSVRIEIQGHCDERGSTMYNLDLGAQRARAVRDHLVRLGIPTGRLETKSYGEEMPAVQGSGEESWGKNRRAEFKAIGK